jgi:hypothetical protein
MNPPAGAGKSVTSCTVSARGAPDSASTGLQIHGEDWDLARLQFPDSKESGKAESTDLGIRGRRPATTCGTLLRGSLASRTALDSQVQRQPKRRTVSRLGPFGNGTPAELLAILLPMRNGSEPCTAKWARSTCCSKESLAPQSPPAGRHSQQLARLPPALSIPSQLSWAY